MLQLVYDSLTGNVKRFAEALAADLGETELLRVGQRAPDREFLLLTYTFGTGQVPETTRQLLRAHGHLLRGVVSSGSFHWGQNFARAADLIAAEYHVPIVAKLNKGGTQADREQVLLWVRGWGAGPPLTPADRRTHGTLD